MRLAIVLAPPLCFIDVNSIKLLGHPRFDDYHDQNTDNSQQNKSRSNKSCITLFVIFALFLSSSSVLYADYNYARLSKSGLGGEELTVAACHPVDENVVLSLVELV